MKTRKTQTFVYKGLGFPIKLVNAPMKKILGKWVININMNKLMEVALEALAYKPAPLTGGELYFIRTYLQMPMQEFGKAFGVSHVAVLKWESGKNKISPALELCIRLYILDFLKAKDREFRALYKEFKFSKSKKIHPLVVNVANEDLKIAL